MKDLRGRVVVITGASGGLGGRLAAEFAAAGAHLVLAGRDREALAQVRKGLAASEVLAVATDLCDAEDRRALLDETLRHFGHIDVLVNNAGIGRFTDYRDEDAEQLYRTNLLAPAALTRLAVGHMLDRGGGHIVNVCSIAALAAPPYLANYAASKAGLLALTHALRLEFRPHGVSATAVCPGFMGDAGMYVPYEGATPWYLGETSTSRVAHATVRAVRRDRAAIVVNPRPVRPLALLTAGWPGAAQAAMRRLGLPGFSSGLAAKRLPYATPVSQAVERDPGAG